MRKAIIFMLCIFSVLHVACQKNLTGPSPQSFDWKQAAPASQGFDSAQLEKAFEQAKLKPFIHSIVVTRNGFLIAERYYNNTNSNTAHTTRSVSKSFLSALYGIALNEGHITTLDTLIVDEN